MNLFNFSLEHILAFFTILVRTSFIIYFMPIIGEAFVARKVKIPLVLIITFVMYPVTTIDVRAFPQTVGGFLLAIIPEALLGLGVALMGKLIFAGVQIGGQLSGMQIGFGFSNVVSPTESAEISITAQQKYLLSILLFLILNIHYLFFKALALSFSIIPPSKSQ